MANPERSKSPRVPSRAASLQRMLEIERKQKMERMQRQNSPVPIPGRRGVSPASQPPSSSKPGLLHRRRDSSVPGRQDDPRTSTVRSFMLPPLSIHTQPAQPITLVQERPANQTKPKTAPPKETRRVDRDNLPSMAKAVTTHEPSNLKTVSFAPSEDGDQSDSSSICHSPTWDDFGKKKRKDADARRKRLTKEPPLAAMENRPVINPRAMSDPILNNKHSHLSAESPRSSQQLNSAKTEGPPVLVPSQSNGVESVETVARSPAFIGGVRLEREREAAMKRLINARTPSEERPAPEMMLRADQPQSNATDASNQRETAPAVSYPPTSSKTPFLKQSGQPRPRRGSFGQGLKAAAGKLFTSKDKDLKNEQPFNRENGSQESVRTVQNLFSPSQYRGRQMSADTLTHSRGQSYDSHERYTAQKEERRGPLSLPPVSWKNKRKNRTTSMMAIPPDSARDGSFSPDGSPGVKQDNFGFLEQPFSPPADGPLSPLGSLPASMKSKMSPQSTPTSAGSPAWQPSSKKTLKEALKAGFRSSSATPEARPTRPRSGTNDTLVGTDTEIPLPRDSHPLQSHPVASGQSANGSPALSSRTARRSDEHHISSPLNQTKPGVDSKDSGASSSSSHPDSESQPPSPITTPETSRPQSSKDNQTLRIDDLRKVPLTSHDAHNYAVRHPGATAPGEQASGYFSSMKLESPRINGEQPSASPKKPVGRQRGRSGSNFIEDLPASQPFLIGDLWTGSKKPLDMDQLSFTSALTSLDVKRSFTELDSAIESSLQSPNSDVTPLSLDRDHNDAAKTKATMKKAGLGVSQAPAGLKLPYGSGVSSRPSDNSSLPTLPSQSLPRGTNGCSTQALLPSKEADQRTPSSHARTESPTSYAQPPSKASAYLQEARRAAPASPRAPTPKASSNSSLPGATTTSLAGPRTFALAGLKSTATVPSPLNDSAANSNLGKPIAKMLVECCHCKFYQDMPSRVYEAMARPDDVVKDKRLGVSGQVTTCVKCPWCSHNMSTVCCAGYAAVVYLREKLHGP